MNVDMKNLILIVASLFFFACSSDKESEKKDHRHFAVNIKGGSDPDLLKNVMDNMESRLIQLETNDSLLFNGKASYLYVTSDYLFVADLKQKIILRYDKQGKFINKINRKGQGPEEYITLANIYFNVNAIYVCDLTKILVYDFNGEYLKTIIPPKDEIGQFYIDPSGLIVQSRYYLGDSQLIVYDEDGKLIKEYFPTPEVIRDFWIVQGCYRSIGNYNGGTFVSNYFDTNIYMLEGDSIQTFATFDFGSMNLPKDFFEGETKELVPKFNDFRENDKAVLNIDNITITDNWIVFCPPLFEPKEVIYCNRKNGKYLINNDFNNFYAQVLGKYDAPDGYDSRSGEFYRLVNAALLKEAIEELQQSDGHYLEKYPFLKGIDPEKIDEESNDWVIFFKM